MDNKLPPEVLEHLFLQVSSPCDLFTLRVVCRQWHAVITNEHFLSLYFHKRFGSHMQQQLQWFDLRWLGIPPSLLPLYQSLPLIRENLRGSGGTQINSRSIGCIAPLLSSVYPLNEYSIGMWLKLSTAFESITFSMRSKDFSLEFLMTRQYIHIRCSHMDGLGAQAHINVSCRRSWIYIVLTNQSASSPSAFIFWIDGKKYLLVPIHGPLSYHQLEANLVHDDFDGDLKLRYEDNINDIKFGSKIDVADVQILPCCLTQHEIHAIIKQSTSIDKLDMATYTLERWTSLHRYHTYSFSRCILL